METPVFIRLTFIYTSKYEEEHEMVGYINPEYIKAITPYPEDEDLTFIRFIFDNTHVVVKESIDEIGQKIKEAEQRAHPVITLEAERTGEWIEAERFGYVCSSCGKYQVIDDDGKHDFHFCPNCGANMRGETK